MTSNQVFRRVAICLAFSSTLLVGLNSTIAQNKEMPAAGPVKKTITWSVEEVENRIQDLDREIKAAEKAQNEKAAGEWRVIKDRGEVQPTSKSPKKQRWNLEKLPIE